VDSRRVDPPARLPLNMVNPGCRARQGEAFRGAGPGQ
jgi:hypothetical protein